MLLSRSAQTVYWFGRYVERADDLARAVLAYDCLMLDTPHLVGFQPGAESEWRELGAPDGERTHEHERLCAWLFEESDPSSVLGALRAAREDLRLMRPIVPNDSFRVLNELYLELRSHRNARGAEVHALLRRVIDGCALLTGQMVNGMLRDQAYSFVELGRSVERADMLLRITRLFATLITPSRAQPFDDVRWMALLQSVGAYPMYRRCYHGRVELGRAFDFLIEDARCPRSLKHCMQTMQRRLITLPKNQLPLLAVRSCHARLPSVAGPWSLPKVLECTSRLLPQVDEIHQVLSNTYFVASPSVVPERPSGEMPQAVQSFPFASMVGLA